MSDKIREKIDLHIVYIEVTVFYTKRIYTDFVFEHFQNYFFKAITSIIQYLNHRASNKDIL